MGTAMPAGRDMGRAFAVPELQPPWQLDIVEVTGHNLEARGRKEVNLLLQSGWRLLYIYTLTYNDKGVWRERPMAILVAESKYLSNDSARFHVRGEIRQEKGSTTSYLAAARDFAGRITSSFAAFVGLNPTIPGAAQAYKA